MEFTYGGGIAAELLVLSARDIACEPAVAVKLPRRVPPGFGGSFLGA